MIRCLTKNSAFTMVEMMIAVAFTVLLMAGVFNFYNTSSQSYTSGISGQTLQDGTNVVLSKITEGESESGVVYRLSTAVSYMIPNGAAGYLYTCGASAQAAPCNASNTSGEIYYCQDTPCGSGDATARWYYLNSTGTAVIYHHPKSGGGTIEETIYSAPKNSTITLRFSPATSIPANEVEIDVALTKTLAGSVTNKRLATTGTTSTYVLLRDHP